MQPTELPKKVVFCVPTLTRPFEQTLKSLKRSVPELKRAGWLDGMVSEIGCPYISNARATMLRKALDAGATQIIFIDHDVSWPKGAVLKLLDTEGDVVGCTYRYKEREEKYMGTVVGEYPETRADGCIKMLAMPAGFLRVSRHAVNLLMRKYPELMYGEPCHPSFDLFQHGAHEGVWWGEDYAFCRRWISAGGDVWCIPDLDIAHHAIVKTRRGAVVKTYRGNFHQYLRKRPGGDLSDSPVPPSERITQP